MKNVFYARFSPRVQGCVDLAGSLLFLIPFCAVAIWSSQTFVANAFRFGETSPDPGGLPARFLLKSAIPVGFLLLMLQGVALAIKSWLKIVGQGQVPENVSTKKPA